MDYEQTASWVRPSRTRAPVIPPTKQVTIRFMIGAEENFQTIRATDVIPMDNGTLLVRTPESNITFANWVSFEER